MDLRQVGFGSEMAYRLWKRQPGSCVMRKGSGSGGGQWHDGHYGYLGRCTKAVSRVAY